MDIYYVYLLIDPRNDAPFYVGKGKANRAWHHTKQVKLGRNTDNPYKDAVIRQILDEGLEPKIIIPHSDLPEDAAYKIEERLIEELGRRIFGGVLTNLCESNRPPKGYGVKHDHNGSKNPNFGRKHPGINSGEANAMFGKRNESNPNYGSRRSEETRAKMSLKKKGLSYEERYGPERAVEVREKKRLSMQGKNKGKKGKTYEELYGAETGRGHQDEAPWASAILTFDVFCQVCDGAAKFCESIDDFAMNNVPIFFVLGNHDLTQLSLVLTRCD